MFVAGLYIGFGVLGFSKSCQDFCRVFASAAGRGLQVHGQLVMMALFQIVEQAGGEMELCHRAKPPSFVHQKHKLLTIISITC